MLIDAQVSKKDTGLNRLIKNLEKSLKNRLDVGFFDGQTHPDFNGSLATLAYENAQVRPFLDFTIKINGFFLKTDIEPMLLSMLEKGTYKLKMRSLAVKYISAIESTIYSLEYLPNSFAWEQEKQRHWGEFRPPLIDSGYMIGHIRYRIE